MLAKPISCRRSESGLAMWLDELSNVRYTRLKEQLQYKQMGDDGNLEVDSERDVNFAEHKAKYRRGRISSGTR
jgi:hypothetical protein